MNIPPVFYSILGSPGEQLRDLRPLVPESALRLAEHRVLSSRPCTLPDPSVQVVQPALSALLARPPRKLSCDEAPVGDECHDCHECDQCDE